jgi:hypothetical protein
MGGYGLMIAAGLRYRLSNARVGSCTTRMRLIMRCAFGSDSEEGIIALAERSLGEVWPALAGS